VTLGIKDFNLFKTILLGVNPMAELLSKPVRFIYIYRGYILVKGELLFVRFDTFIRRVKPQNYYDCVDMQNMAIYSVLGQNIFNYHLYNVRPLTKSDLEYIPELPMQQ
jgi:hypothetical protein